MTKSLLIVMPKSDLGLCRIGFIITEKDIIK